MGGPAENVSGWPLESYPFKDSKKRPVSNWWKIAVLQPNGFIRVDETKNMVKDLSGKEVEVVSVKRFEQFVTSLDGPASDNEELRGLCMTSRIYPEDIRRIEEEFGGKPSIVLMGLWARWDGKQWIKTDRTKTASPLYYTDVTDKYFDEWRKEAYNGEYEDPYKDTKRPTTHLDDMNKRLADLEKENAALKAAAVKK